MGKYYSAEKVKNGGFKQVYPINGKQPETAGRLVGVFDQLIYEVCVDLTRPSEFDEFYGQYSRGLFVRVALFDVPEDADIDK